MKNRILFVALFMAAGCRADMVISPGKSSNSPYAPINETQRPGVIKYLNAGAQGAREARREDAFRQMHSVCGGSYKVVDESTRSEGGTAIADGDVAVYANDQYVYIRFECIAQKQ